MNDEPLEVIDKFKYCGTTLMKDGKSETEIHIRMTTVTSALVHLSTIWKNQNISLQIKILQYTVQITNIVYTIYGCETWTLIERLERIITAF